MCSETAMPPVTPEKHPSSPIGFEQKEKFDSLNVPEELVQFAMCNKVFFLLHIAQSTKTSWNIEKSSTRYLAETSRKVWKKQTIYGCY